MSELTPEEDEALKKVAGVIVAFGKVSKILAWIVIGGLSFIVLLSQAWDIVRAKLH